MAHTVLITGANGFIGSHTTLLMESLGHKVIPIDAVPRSTDLSLLGIKNVPATSWMSPMVRLFERFATRKNQPMSFMPHTLLEMKIPPCSTFAIMQ